MQRTPLYPPISFLSMQNRQFVLLNIYEIKLKFDAFSSYIPGWERNMSFERVIDIWRVLRTYTVARALIYFLSIFILIVIK